MTFKTILVQCDASDAATSRMVSACDVARRSGAHLVGLHVNVPFELPLGISHTSFDMEKFCSECRAAVRADAEKSAACFRQAVANQGLSFEWREIEYRPDAVVAYARYADLIVVGRSDPDAPIAGIPADLAEAVALNSGRAVLVIPHRGSLAIPGKTVLLCWKDSREAARAAADALPFLQAAEQVIVLTIGITPSLKDEESPAGIKAIAWLVRHGVKAIGHHQTGADGDAGAFILARAQDLGVDLIVMGAYGHSRLREVVLGGASRTVLAGMKVPVFMAH